MFFFFFFKKKPCQNQASQQIPEILSKKATIINEEFFEFLKKSLKRSTYIHTLYSKKIAKKSCDLYSPAVVTNSAIQDNLSKYSYKILESPLRTILKKLR